MQVWDKEANEWLERAGVDAGEILRLYPERYSRTKPEASEPVSAEVAPASPERKGKGK